MELKKTAEADLEKGSSVLKTLGIMAALALTLVSFQWRWYDVKPPDEMVYTGDNLEDEEVPVSQEEYIPPEEPKKQEQVVLEIIEDDEEIEETAEMESTEIDMDTEIAVIEEEEEEVNEDEIFSYAEEMPSFPGGDQAMYEYMAKNTKYPTLAKESGIQGKVFVGFVVKRDGSIADVKVLRGIGGGCDEEAVRVVKSMPKWNAGKQRGKPVSVEFRIPYQFVLQ